MDMAVKPRLGIGRRIGPDVARVAVRQIKGKEVCFLLDAADYNKRFTKIGLCMTRRMAQRHEHLLAGPLPVSNVILDDGVAAIKTALVPQPLENTLCSVALLARAAPVFSKPLVHLAGERIQLRAPDRRCSPISRRLRIGQHLRNTVPADPKIPGNLASAQSILEMSVTHLQIQIHGVYPQALPKSERAKVDDFYAARDTTTVPLPWPSIAPPFTPLVGGKSGSQTAGILQRVRDRQPATALLARDANQDVVPVFGNVDSDQQGRSGRLDGGHSRSPQWCGLRKTTVET